MAITNAETSIGLYAAAEDLSSHQWRGVRLNTLGPKPAWQKPYSSGLVQGILVNKAVTGANCTVQIVGICKAVVGAAPLAGGRPVGFDADGALIAGGVAATTIGSGQPGEIIEVLLGGVSASVSTFSYQNIDTVVTIPVGQQMPVFGCLELNSELVLNGELILQE